MQQILNRIGRLFKSNISYVNKKIDYEVIDESDELRKIIDELNRNNNNGSSSNERYYKPDYVIKDKRLIASLHILGLDYTSDFSIIKAAYRKKIAIYHPDKAGKMNDSERISYLKKTQEINAAYSYIKNYYGV